MPRDGRSRGGRTSPDVAPASPASNTISGGTSLDDGNGDEQQLSMATLQRKIAHQQETIDRVLQAVNKLVAAQGGVARDLGSQNFFHQERSASMSLESESQEDEEPRELQRRSSSASDTIFDVTLRGRKRDSMVVKAIESHRKPGNLGQSLHGVSRKAKTAKVALHPFMISPKSGCKLAWDIGLIAPLLIYFTIMIPFRLSFVNDPQCETAMYWFEFVVEVLFVVDIIINFRTGFFVALDEAGGDTNFEDMLVEMDPGLVAHNYLKTWLPLDLVSGIPFMLIDRLVSGGGCDDAELQGVGTELRILKSMRILRLLKLTRLIKFDQILKSTVVSQDMDDMIHDFFEAGLTRSALRMFSLLIQIGYICHFMACLWVYVGRNARSDTDSWLYADPLGPFDKSETMAGENVGTIYLAAYYFCITTMTSVGFGDVSANNNSERIFIILLEILGGFVFGLIIASLTSVVTAMDINDRQAQEERDAVASFVSNRQFPKTLSRRIRRHFRQYYKVKIAVDEQKIFTEMSPLLRMEVSSYIVMIQMSEVKLFQTMDPLLWSSLLMLLRPVRFEKTDHVACQGEDCYEMYVVLKGDLTGTSTLADGTMKARDITTGDNINVLCLLKVWDKCVESVEPRGSVDAYAISAEEFGHLFDLKIRDGQPSNPNDVQTFEIMRQLELKNFRVDRSPAAFAANPRFGIPLYVAFSCVSFSLIRAKDLVARDIMGTSDPYALVELVFLDSGEVVNHKYRYCTETHWQTLNPIFREGAHWRDVFLPFQELAMRVRLYDKDKYATTDDPLGEVLVPLTDVASDLNEGSTPRGKEQARHRLKKLQGGMKMAVAKEQWGTTLGRIEDRGEEEDEGSDGDHSRDNNEDEGKNEAVGGKAELKQGAGPPPRQPAERAGLERQLTAEMNWKVLNSTLSEEKEDPTAAWYDLRPLGDMQTVTGSIFLRIVSKRSEAAEEMATD